VNERTEEVQCDRKIPRYLAARGHRDRLNIVRQFVKHPRNC